MPIARHFIDWAQPALPAAADWLVARAAKGQVLDLAQTIVVVPGSRAGRRLLELLVERADAQSLVLTPPIITTEHALPELLYQPKRPFASQLTQQLAWSAALQETPPSTRRHFLPLPPANGETARWLELGDMLRRLHVELAADGLDFNNVLAGGERIDGFAEHDRWQTLADVQQRYLKKLDDLDLWDIQTARLVAIRQREPQSDRDIVLVGMVDLNRAQRQLLDLVAAHVTALVFAPQSLADHFDQHGCLVPERWVEIALSIRDEQVVRVDGPADQAEAVTRWLASLGGKYRADQIVVGVPDERLAPAIARQLTQCGVASRWVEAKRLAETGPYRLLKVAAEYAQRNRFADLAALVRHPDVFDWLLKHIDRTALAGQDPLTVLDEFATQYVPASLDASRLAHEPDLAAVAAIARVIGQLTSLLPTSPLPLAEWASAFRSLLGAVYGERVVDRNQPADRYLIEALDKINAGLAALDQLPATMMPKVALRDAFELAIAPLASEPIPPPAEGNVVEILGWLELPLDDAPALVVTTFNEGFVPKSTVADSFLPNRLRRELGLLDNDRRYARDAYATSVLAHSRAELRLIVGHRDTDGNPLVPSRLLFAAEEDCVVQRARDYFGDLPPSPPRRNLLADKPPRATSGADHSQACQATAAGRHVQRHRVSDVSRLPVSLLPAARVEIAARHRLAGRVGGHSVRHAPARRAAAIQPGRRASTQGVCPDKDPPETTFTKEAPKELDRSRFKFKFSSDEPGSHLRLPGRQAALQAVQLAPHREAPRRGQAQVHGRLRHPDPAGNTRPGSGEGQVHGDRLAIAAAFRDSLSSDAPAPG